jgi:hypothetical protein
MSVLWLERPTDPSVSLASPGLFDGAPATPGSSLFGAVTNGDAISRFTQPALQSDPYDASPVWGGGFSSIVSQLLSVIGQLLGQMGYGGTQNSGSERYYSTASGGSNGDPHLSFNGNTWNDMSAQPDLLCSDSIPGGYRLSTQTTTPDANGITHNQLASVTTQGGRTQVTLERNGNATLTQDGVATNIAPGQTIDLGNETISRGQNGSLEITCTNNSGGQIVTTMSENGAGVNVDTTATDVDLGGSLTAGNTYLQRTNRA